MSSGISAVTFVIVFWTSSVIVGCLSGCPFEALTKEVPEVEAA